MTFRPHILRFVRRFRLWTRLRHTTQSLLVRSASALHRLVEALDGGYLPLDLVLKHHYDTEAVWVDPRWIKALVPVRADIGRRRNAERGLIGWLKVERELGGSWKSVNQHPSRNFHGKFIVGGDWDLRAKPFEPLSSIVLLVEEGAEPKETGEYQKLRQKIEDHDFYWTRGMRSVEELDAYFAGLVAVISDIRNNGYRSQTELGNREADEIRVCIDRHGRLNVFGGGTHRLSIAQLLGVPEVPVVVKRVHTAWVSYCVDRYGGPIPAAIARGLEELAARKPD